VPAADVVTPCRRALHPRVLWNEHAHLLQEPERGALGGEMGEGNKTSCMIAIHPNSPISKAESSRKSAPAGSFSPSPERQMAHRRDDEVLEQDPPAQGQHAIEGVFHWEREPASCSPAPKKTHSAIRSPRTQPAPQWVALTAVPAQNGLPGMPRPRALIHL
jgi:hypothetical protein